MPLPPLSSWSPCIAAWFDGQDDRRRALLRPDPRGVETWKNGSNLLARIKMLFGAAPAKECADKQAYRLSLNRAPQTGCIGHLPSFRRGARSIL